MSSGKPIQSEVHKIGDLCEICLNPPFPGSPATAATRTCPDATSARSEPGLSGRIITNKKENWEMKQHLVCNQRLLELKRHGSRTNMEFDQQE